MLLVELKKNLQEGKVVEVCVDGRGYTSGVLIGKFFEELVVVDTDTDTVEVWGLYNNSSITKLVQELEELVDDNYYINNVLDTTLDEYFEGEELTVQFVDCR